MSNGLNLLREEAKRIYKENSKKVPKSKRIPFSQFFKQYKEAKKAQQPQEAAKAEQKDFDFGDMVNNNDLSQELVDAELVGTVDMRGEISTAEIEKI